MRITPHPECAEQRSRPLEAPVDWAVMKIVGFHLYIGHTYLSFIAARLEVG